MGNRFWRLVLSLFIMLINIGCSSAPVRKPASIPGKKNGLYLVWPVAKPKISQEFIRDDDDPHDGIDIHMEVSVLSQHLQAFVQSLQAFLRDVIGHDVIDGDLHMFQTSVVESVDAVG